MQNDLTVKQLGALMRRALAEYEKSGSRPQDVFYARVAAGKHIYKIGIEPNVTPSKTIVDIRVVVRGDNNGNAN